jgi:transposase-like protein
LWRAVDELGVELDIVLQKRPDKTAAKRFFKRVLRSSPVPRKIVTDQLRSYPAARPSVKHVFVKAAARINNRAENSHQPTRERERRMRGFRDPRRTQAFLSCFGADQATLRAQAASAASFTLSQTPRGAIRHVARIRRTRSKFVDWFLNNGLTCHRFASSSVT